MKQCNKCKTDVNTNHRFCYNCGSELYIYSKDDITNLIEKSNLVSKFKRDEILSGILLSALQNDSSIDYIQDVIGHLSALPILDNFNVIFNCWRINIEGNIPIRADYSKLFLTEDMLFHYLLQDLICYIEPQEIEKDVTSKLNGFIIDGRKFTDTKHNNKILVSTRRFDELFHIIIPSISPNFCFGIGISPEVEKYVQIYEVENETMQ